MTPVEKILIPRLKIKKNNEVSMIAIMATDSKNTTRTFFNVNRLVVLKQKSGVCKALFEVDETGRTSEPVKAKDKAQPDFFELLDAQERAISEALRALNTD